MNILNLDKLDSSCFNGVYRELAELVGVENTIIIHQHFAGQHFNFSKKLLSDEYVRRQIMKEYDGTNGRELSQKYGYTYSWMMKLIKQLQQQEESKT